MHQGNSTQYAHNRGRALGMSQVIKSTLKVCISGSGMNYDNLFLIALIKMKTNGFVYGMMETIIMHLQTMIHILQEKENEERKGTEEIECSDNVSQSELRPFNQAIINHDKDYFSVKFAANRSAEWILTNKGDSIDMSFEIAQKGNCELRRF